jgi:WD40 repeat protein
VYNHHWEPSAEQLLPYDSYQPGSMRQYVYFTSRVAVVANNGTLKQRFYEGHASKIACMTVHPSRKSIATGECVESPQIHVWNVLYCTPEAVIQTHHGAGIVNLAFSRCGDLLVSVGVDKYFSLQVTDWKNEEIVAFRNTSPNPIVDVVVNPYDKYEFATCGHHLVQIWTVSGNAIVLKENVYVTVGDKNELPYITCLRYMYYLLQDDVQCDLVVGTNLGSLGLVSHGKYILTVNVAHKKMVTCIKVTDVFRNRVAIITAGEDEVVKIWDSSFDLISELKLREIDIGIEIVSNVNYFNYQKVLSVQSLDIYGLDQSTEGHSMEDQDPVNFQNRKPLMLLGLRNGDIIEVDLECEYDNEPQEDYSEEDNEAPSKDIELAKVNFNARLLLRNHSMQSSGDKFDLIEHNKQKKLHIAVHPKETLMATIGSDKNLCFWDTYEHRIVEKKELQTQPTCLKWSNDSEGTFLVVGFITGVLDIYQLTEVKTVYDKSANSSN